MSWVKVEVTRLKCVSVCCSRMVCLWLLQLVHTADMDKTVLFCPCWQCEQAIRLSYVQNGSCQLSLQILTSSCFCRKIIIWCWFKGCQLCRCWWEVKLGSPGQSASLSHSCSNLSVSTIRQWFVICGCWYRSSCCCHWDRQSAGNSWRRRRWWRRYSW